MSKAWIYQQTKKVMPPNPAAIIIADAFLYFLDKFLGQGLEEAVFIYRDGEVTCYSTADGVIKITKAAHDKINSDFSIASKTQKIFQKKAVSILNVAKQISCLKLDELSNKQLWLWYEKYFNIYHDAYPYSEPLAWILKDSYVKDLELYLSSRVSANILNNILQQLLTPPKLSFIGQEEYELMKLACKWQSIAQKTKSNKLPSLIQKALIRHAEQFSWIPYDYGIRLYDLSEFKKRLVKLFNRNGLNIKIVHCKNYAKNVLAEQNKIYKQYKIDKHHQNAFSAMQTLAFLNDYKKEIFTKSHVLTRGLQNEIAKRLGISWEMFGFIFIDELKEALCSDKVLDKIVLKQRYHYSVFTCKKGEPYFFITGKDARKLVLDIIHKDSREEIVKELKGMTACRGIVTGKVKILLSSADCGKVKEGDIIVAKMTSPDYITAIKKAKAIITDEGGIICHAAIISRELKKPCIIGTKIATKVLKDGDLVELNADKGIIKILQK